MAYHNNKKPPQSVFNNYVNPFILDENELKQLIGASSQKHELHERRDTTSNTDQEICHTENIDQNEQMPRYQIYEQDSRSMFVFKQNSFGQSETLFRVPKKRKSTIEKLCGRSRKVNLYYYYLKEVEDFTKQSTTDLILTNKQREDLLFDLVDNQDFKQLEDVENKLVNNALKYLMIESLRLSRSTSSNSAYYDFYSGFDHCLSDNNENAFCSHNRCQTNQLPENHHRTSYFLGQSIKNFSEAKDSNEIAYRSNDFATPQNQANVINKTDIHQNSYNKERTVLNSTLSNKKNIQAISQFNIQVDKVINDKDIDVTSVANVSCSIDRKASQSTEIHVIKRDKCSTDLSNASTTESLNLDFDKLTPIFNKQQRHSFQHHGLAQELQKQNTNIPTATESTEHNTLKSLSEMSDGDDALIMECKNFLSMI